MHQQQGCMRHDAMRKEEIRMLHEIGAITVGQSPRVDVMPDLEPLLSGIRVIQKGALDGMTREEMKKIEPEPGDYVLVSRLQDGSSVRMSEKFILPIIQKYIDAFNRQGVEGILMLCTGEFPHFTSHIPLLYPQKLLKAVTMAVLEKHQTLGILTPDSSQVQQARKRWLGYGASRVCVEAASPYLSEQDVIQAGLRLKEQGASLIVMDCIGYTQNMKDIVHRETGLSVILGRTVAARIAAELFG
ncbi:AroM family protein [Mitsuokella sp. AF21-1AC]|uniref:AroM family protein n=1 Tax=Mitsuokella sp. AF21-1AC TaxID=2292235 RepID=UPI001F4812D2|nr:AroM family protein [Mitsuokella sp. AF21-1AC]